MFEKVSPMHPDKIADRIAGAIVDLTYTDDLSPNPRVACEVLIGHGECTIINETSVPLNEEQVFKIVTRIAGVDNIKLHYVEVPQNELLAANQEEGIRCADNGIFKGVPITEEEKKLSEIARNFYDMYYDTDGKYILDTNQLIICQSHLSTADGIALKDYYEAQGYNTQVNPLGEWTGGINVDSGATNRKLGSDMGEAVTGGGLHGKDLSKGDVSINIYLHLKAQATQQTVCAICAIGDTMVDGRPYEEIVEIARNYIQEIGGFEKFAEFGLI